MASEAVVADHPTSSEVKEVHEEVKTCKPEIISPAEVEKPELEDLLPIPVAPLSESEDKIVAKPIEDPINEELKERDEEEKTRDEKLPTPIAPVADAEEKVEGKNFGSSVVTQEKKAAEEEIPIAEVEPTSEEKPKSVDVSNAAVVLAKEVQPLASEVFPSVEPELKVEDKNFEPSIIEEVKITSETHVAEEAKIVAEPPLVEEKIIIEPFVLEEKLVQSPVTEEEKNTIEELAVEEKMSTETPVAEAKLVQTPVVEEAEDTIEEFVVEEKISIETPLVEDKLVQTPEAEVANDSTIEQLVVKEKITEIPVIEEAKITAEPPVVKERIVIEPLSVEEKLVHSSVVKAAEETNEPPVMEEEILTGSLVGEEKLGQDSVVEESKVATEQIIDEEKTTTGTSETEEENTAIEPPLMEEKIKIEPPVEVEIVENPVVGGSKNTIETPSVEEVKNTTKTPLVEENDAIEATIVEEENDVAKAPVVEAANHISESFVVEEVKKDIHAPDVSVEDKSVVAQDFAAATDTHDVSEPEAKIVETNPVTDDSETPEAGDAKVEFVEVKLREKEADILELSTKIVDKKEEEVGGPVKDSEPDLVKDVEIPEPRPIKEEVHETSTVVVGKPQEYVVVEAKKSVEVPKQDESIEEASLEAITLSKAILPSEEDQTNAKEEISAGKADLDEELPKQEAHTLVKVEAETEVKDLKDKAEDCSQHETIEADEVIKSIPTTEVAEHIMEGLVTSRDSELIAENGNEGKKSESVSPVETCSNGTMGDKSSEKPDDDKLEKPDDKVTLEDPPKEVVRVKSTQKQSNTILSKMKNTLVKAKKAITGKSANGKTPALEPKGEIKV